MYPNDGALGTCACSIAAYACIVHLVEVKIHLPSLHTGASSTHTMIQSCNFISVEINYTYEAWHVDVSTFFCLQLVKEIGKLFGAKAKVKIYSTLENIKGSVKPPPKIFLYIHLAVFAIRKNIILKYLMIFRNRFVDEHFCLRPLNSGPCQSSIVCSLKLPKNRKIDKTYIRPICLYPIIEKLDSIFMNHFQNVETYLLGRASGRAMLVLKLAFVLFSLGGVSSVMLYREHFCEPWTLIKKNPIIGFNTVLGLTRCRTGHLTLCSSTYGDIMRPIYRLDFFLKKGPFIFIFGLGAGPSLAQWVHLDANQHGSRPRAPWFGALYEWMIGTLKGKLAKMLGRAVLTYFELDLHLKEITGLLNNRPLTSVGSEEVYSTIKDNFLVSLVNLVLMSVDAIPMIKRASELPNIVGQAGTADTLGISLTQFSLLGTMKDSRYRKKKVYVVKILITMTYWGIKIHLLQNKFSNYFASEMLGVGHKNKKWSLRDKDGSGELGLLQCRSTASDYDSSDDEDFARDVHKHINKYRKKHAVPKIKLSKEVCQYAKEWAIKMAKEDKMQMRPDCIYGTNVFCMSANSQTFKIEGKNIVDRWYGEIKDHTFGEEPEENILKSGHFSQLIWKDTKMIGIAKARSDTGFKIYVAAHFAPKGNWSGQFTKQVPPIGGFPKGSKGRTSIFSKMRNVSVNSIDVSSDEEDLIDDCIKSHNEYRKKHRVRPLKKNKELNRFAKEWAIICARRDTMEHRPNNQYGENIYRSWSSTPGHKIKGNVPVESWYEEISDFIFGEEPTDTRAGHFTQLVWEDSREVGVGVARSQSGWLYVVANYKPAGNYVGSFATKVHKPKV
ncbi:unnamed protein product, partial [Meganyctiphanes norvegica]